jgi:radical SAM superfamily enzyme YgiQ (UPF0313 family)
MKILLISPPYPSSECSTIPMGLSYIAAVLQKEGHEVQVLDFLLQRYSPRKVRAKISEFDPNMVGITSVTLNFFTASNILKVCKRANPDITTMMGGPHVTFTAEETLKTHPWIDIVVRSEGEYTMADVARGKRLEDTPGISFRRNGNVMHTESRKLISDLDELPFPARRLFPIARYLAYNPECGLVTSRGCPFDCIFCVGHKMVGRKTRYRDVKMVCDEIEDILRLGFRGINIVDDLFTLSRKHVLGLCDEILSRKLRFKWTCFARVDTVDDELLRRMKEAGCYYTCYGVESGNQDILDSAKKKITLDEIRRAVRLAKDNGINVLASCILGLPGETKETIRQSMEFVRELNTPYGFHLLAPFPGTEVREKAKEYGIKIITNNWRRYDANEAVTCTKDVTCEEANELSFEYRKNKAKYDELFLKLEEERERKEKVSPEEIEERSWFGSALKRRAEVADVVLKNDVIEGIRRKGLSLEQVTTYISSRFSLPLPQVSAVLESWVSEGILKNNHGRWMWTEW